MMRLVVEEVLHQGSEVSSERDSSCVAVADIAGETIGSELSGPLLDDLVQPRSVLTQAREVSSHRLAQGGRTGKLRKYAQAWE